MVAIAQVELGDFVRSAKKHIGKDWLVAVTRAFAGIAEDGRDSGRALTREKFKLHTEHIPRGIKHYPENATQQRAAMHALQKYGDMNAAVYLRGANDPKRSLGFMAEHEYGEEREAHSPWVSLNGMKYIAVPLEDLLKKASKTSSGRIAKRYRPSALLERFSKSGSSFFGITTDNTGVKYRPRNTRRIGSAFIISSAKKRIPMIAQSRDGGFIMEFLYALVPQAHIRVQWGFVKRIYETVDKVYYDKIRKAVWQMPSYGG